MSINAKHRKIIKRYAKLRSTNNPSLKEDILLETYNNSTTSQREFYLRECKEYIKAVDSGELKAGLPITMLGLNPVSEK